MVEEEDRKETGKRRRKRECKRGVAWKVEWMTGTKERWAWDWRGYFLFSYFLSSLLGSSRAKKKYSS